MENRKILVSGGNGFVASHVILELKKRGFKVITNVRNQTWALDPIYKDILADCDVYNIDIRDEAGVYKLVELSDGVIHLASILGTKHVDNAKPFYETNLYGTINVLEACKEFNIPMVYIGVGNYFEHNNYSNSKVAAEREVLKYSKFCGVKGNVVRALNAVGERQKVKNTGKIMATFITQALNNEDIIVYGGKDHCSLMDMVYAGDVAKVLCDVLLNLDDTHYIEGESEIFYDIYETDEYGKHLRKLSNDELTTGLNYSAVPKKVVLSKRYGNIFEAGTGIGYSVYDIAMMIKMMTGSHSRIVEVPMRDGESANSKVVAEKPFPIVYKTLESIIGETIEFYKKQNASK